MGRWYRHYAGLCRDEKLVSVAIKSKQPIERVVWVWCAILENAAEIDDDGRHDVDAAEFAYFLRADQGDIDAIMGALEKCGRLVQNRVVKWSNRQFSSDRSRDRVAAYRERKRGEGCNGDMGEGLQENSVTLQKRYRNSPELDTDTDTERGNLKAHIVDNPARAFSESPSPPDFENPMACENCNAPTINRDSANLAKIDASATYVAEAAKSHVTAFRSALTENPVLETRKAVAEAYQAAGELPPDTSRIGQWIANGFTPDEIKSCIAAVLQRGTKPKSLKYFDQALVEIRTAPRAPPMQGKPNKPPARGSAAIANALDEIVENGYTHSSSIDQNASLRLSVA